MCVCGGGGIVRVEASRRHEPPPPWTAPRSRPSSPLPCATSCSPTAYAPRPRANTAGCAVSAAVEHMERGDAEAPSLNARRILFWPPESASLTRVSLDRAPDLSCASHAHSLLLRAAGGLSLAPGDERVVRQRTGEREQYRHCAHRAAHAAQPPLLLRPEGAAVPVARNAERHPTRVQRRRRQRPLVLAQRQQAEKERDVLSKVGLNRERVRERQTAPKSRVSTVRCARARVHGAAAQGRTACHLKKAPSNKQI